MYPTPTKGMHKQDVNDNGQYAKRVKDSGFQVMLPAFVKLSAKQKTGGRLNPTFCEALMGFPLNWTKITTTD
jgi:hypothetical protein